MNMINSHALCSFLLCIIIPCLILYTYFTTTVCIPGRTSKQVRERWCNHLDPEINRAPFTAKEDEVIEVGSSIDTTALMYFLCVQNLQNVHGNQWARISRELPGRPEEAVKIRWRSLHRTKPAKRLRVRFSLNFCHHYSFL